MRRRANLIFRAAPFLAVCVGAACLAIGCSDHTTTAKETTPQADPVAVAVAPVTTVTVERVANLVGSFFPNEDATVAPQIESRVVWFGPDMGDHVSAGDVILRLDDADLQAQLREVDAKLAKARADDTRARELRADGIMSHMEAERMGMDAAVLLAQRDLLRVKLDRTIIRAPLSGAIAARTVSVGEIAQIGRPLYKIVQDEPLKFRTLIPERFAASLHMGQEVRLGIAAYPDKRFTGEITRINPTAEEVNRSILIEAVVLNTAGLIKPGYFGSGEIVYDTQSPALVVPEAALTTFAGVTKLFVVTGGKAEERVVRTGVTTPGERREIADGVHEGEQVAVSNLDRLENGAAVTTTSTDPVASTGAQAGS
jgi:membrane fusion protein, multidrug efflux system